MEALSHGGVGEGRWRLAGEFVTLRREHRQRGAAQAGVLLEQKEIRCRKIRNLQIRTIDVNVQQKKKKAKIRKE